MEFQYDLSGGSTAIVKKYHVAATNTVICRPYTKCEDAGSGIVLGTTTVSTDFIGVNVDAAGTYATAQSGTTDVAAITSLIINPLAVYRVRLSGGATDGTALTAHTVTTATSDGLTITHSAFNASSPTMDEGVICGYTGANAGKYRKITSTSSTTTVVTVAFPNDDVVGDQYLHAPIYPTRSIVAELTTNCTEIDATVAISGDSTLVVVEMILNDMAAQGTTQSYALIQFCDSLFGATVT